MIDLENLNDRQKEAVITTEGPLLLIAGAGSGKTRVITNRIAYLISEKNVDPYNILAITFTNKAAKEMRERVNDSVYGGERVWVSTFHSMCVRILRRFAERIGYTQDFAIYDTDDTKSVMREIIKNRNINTKNYKERAILSVISKAKDEMITPSEMAREAGEDYKKKIYSELYADYQTALKKDNAMDFDDLICKTVELFEKNPDVLEAYADRFKYIMVDEYQDTNTSQFRLVELLASKWRNLCVVGDDDQSIYKFRGANIKNILNFEKEFEGTKVIKLEENYRSTQNILNAANAVIDKNRNRKKKTLWTGNEEGELVEYKMFENSYAEADGIAHTIEELERNGWNYSDMAILYRTNSQSRIIEEKLVYRNINYKMYGGVNFYARKEIKDILSYLKVISNESNGQALKRIINVPKRGIGATSIGKVEAFADAYGITMWEAIEIADEIPSIGTASKKLKQFMEMINSFKALAEEVTIEELTRKIIEGTEYIDFLAESDSPDELSDRKQNIDEFINKIIAYESGDVSQEYDAAEGVTTEDRSITLGGFLEEVSLIADADDNDDDPNKVVLMTLHSAKGLEFPIVFMAGMEDGLFPGFMSITSDSPDDLEEERRLCYVGMTRAKKKLYMTFAKERMVRGERRVSVPSRFINEIPSQYIHIANNSSIKQDFLTKSREMSDARDSFGIKRKRGPSLRDRGASALAMYGSKKPTKAPSFGKAFPMDGVINKVNSSDVVKTEPKPVYNNETQNTDNKHFEKDSNAPFEKGDRVHNDRFGNGTVTAIEDKTRDWLVTVQFDDIEGPKKMFCGFIKLEKLN